MGDRTRIDDIDVGPLRKGNDSKPIPLKGSPHHLGIELICLAAQSGDGDGFSH
jgi:hypothetical protein